jgi:hypothetical protein
MSEVLIADLRRLAKERDQQGIVAYCIERDGTVRCVTYGETALKCRALGWWGQGWLNAKNFLADVPLRTVFGWGFGGVPNALTKGERQCVPPSVPREFM